MGITVAVTGPTGAIGGPAIEALEREPGVDRILGMARRPFDPASRGWAKTAYRQGDVLDRAAVDALVAEADVVVHLAFLIMGSRSAAARVNLTGTRHVIEAAVAAPRTRRFVYTSSAAAYGYHAGNPSPLTEAVPARGSSEHYYSAQKAACEALIAETTAGSGLDVYVLRPCIVAGPRATTLADSMPWNRMPWNRMPWNRMPWTRMPWTRLGRRLPAPVSGAARAIPGLRPLVPDPGVRVQLVHHDDVAAAIVSAVVGLGTPGAYNLAADGDVSLTEIAHALGARSVRVPRASVRATSQALARLPYVPSSAEWLHAFRTSVLMDTAKAKRELGWHPAYTSAETLDAMAGAL
jgi:nucleoside-diphosphate-sugar epimerase